MTPLPGSQSDVVLIVDDIPENLALLCDCLEDAGYDVLVATDGHSALERLAYVTPDAILLDAVMPGLDGFDTCRRIKANPVCMHVPVVFMTALIETQSIVKGFAAGGVDYVTKPIDPDEVVARVRAHVRTGRALQEARRTIESMKLRETSGASSREAAERFGLTPREAEVLSWIASGKTDRDIADILGMRPRTVNKHLEHIYVKLGVETRTAAAFLVRGLAHD